MYIASLHMFLLLEYQSSVGGEGDGGDGEKSREKGQT